MHANQQNMLRSVLETLITFIHWIVNLNVKVALVWKHISLFCVEISGSFFFFSLEKEVLRKRLQKTNKKKALIAI